MLIDVVLVAALWALYIAGSRGDIVPALWAFVEPGFEPLAGAAGNLIELLVGQLVALLLGQCQVILGPLAGLRLRQLLGSQVFKLHCMAPVLGFTVLPILRANTWVRPQSVRMLSSRG